jgi:diadenosine tetraphosphate (Ap4A) HIT family hydrolase
VEEFCPFCNRLAAGDFDDANGAAVAFGDAFRVGRGTRWRCRCNTRANFFGWDKSEPADMWALVAQVRARLVRQFEPDGFNVRSTTVRRPVRPWAMRMFM